MAPSRSTAGLRWLWLLSAAVIVADQATKARSYAALATGESVRSPAFFSLVLTYNAGAAFSFLAGAGGWQRWLFAAIAVAAIVADRVAAEARRRRRSTAPASR